MYYNGEIVNLEDSVLYGCEEGTIKGIIHQDLYSEDLFPSDWEHLEYGYIILTDFGILYLDELDNDLILVSRNF